MTSPSTIHAKPSREKWDRPIRLTTLYHEHLALDAQMEERAGWLLPMSYGDPASETAAIRDSAGLLDIGDGGKIDIKGDDLDAFLADVFAVSDQVGVGSSAWDEASGMQILRLTADQALVVTEPDALQDVLGRVDAAAAARTCVHAVDLTGALCGLRLLGPRAPSLLERVCALDLTLEHSTNGDVTQGPVAGVHGIILRRDAADLPGYDLYVDRDLGGYLWDSLLEIGAPLGLRPAGRSTEEDTR